MKIDEKAFEHVQIKLGNSLHDNVSIGEARVICSWYEAAKTNQPDQTPQPYIVLTLAEFDQLTAIKRESGSFQQRVEPWMRECFGDVIPFDKTERNHRFIEEALELVQACGATASECHQLVDYVFNRPVGYPYQESGGVMVTHAALCLANGLDMHQNGETELARIWTKIEAIRAKQAAKPKHSPLPTTDIEDGESNV
jgi:hypothetical protein